MSHNQITNHRTLAIAPSTGGVGYAVLEGNDTLVNWGVKSVKKGDKNAQSLAITEDLIAQFKPEVIVLENCFVESSRRRARIRILVRAIADLAPARGLSVILFSKEQVKQALLPEGKGTKHDTAKSLAERFPEELGDKLPSKRKDWESEDRRMDIFDAVALTLMSRI